MERAPNPDAKKKQPAAGRRVRLGTLPAIPFEIVEERRWPAAERSKPEHAPPLNQTSNSEPDREGAVAARATAPSRSRLRLEWAVPPHQFGQPAP